MQTQRIKVQQEWARYRFEGSVWAVRFDWPGTRVAVEVRNAQKYPEFHIIDSEKRQQVRLARKGNLPWLTLADFTREVLLLQLFPEPEKPLTLGLEAWDAQTGILLWSHPGYRFCGPTPQGLLVEDMQEVYLRYKLVDYKTGKLLAQATDQLSPQSIAGLEYVEAERSLLTRYGDEVSTMVLPISCQWQSVLDVPAHKLAVPGETPLYLYYTRPSEDPSAEWTLNLYREGHYPLTQVIGSSQGRILDPMWQYGNSVWVLAGREGLMQIPVSAPELL
jgi:hypothetical protein